MDTEKDEMVTLDGKFGSMAIGRRLHAHIQRFQKGEISIEELDELQTKEMEKIKDEINQGYFHLIY